jgi:hypothetical protein
MAVSGEQRRALQMLAESPLGVTEAIMLAHGFAVDGDLGDPAVGRDQAGGRPLMAAR